MEKVGGGRRGGLEKFCSSSSVSSLGDHSLVAQLVENLPAMQETTCSSGDLGSIPRSGRSPEGGQPTLVFLPGKSHEQGSLVGYGLGGCKS